MSFWKLHLSPKYTMLKLVLKVALPAAAIISLSPALTLQMAAGQAIWDKPFPWHGFYSM